jgi:hypothetical protein
MNSIHDSQAVVLIIIIAACYARLQAHLHANEDNDPQL